MKQAEAVRLFSSINFVWGFWAAPFSVFVAIYLSQAGVSDSAIGLLFGVNFLMALIVSLPSGMLSDRINPRNVMLLGLALTAPFYLALTLTDSLLLLGAIFVIDALGANLYGIAADSAMYRSIESGKGKAFGIIHFVLNLGGALGYLACGYLLTSYGFQGLGLFFLLPAGVMMLFALKIPVASVRLEQGRVSSYLKDFRRKEFLLLAAAVFLLAYHWGAEKTSFPLYASNVLLLSNEQLGLFFSANLAVYAVAGLLAGRLIEVSRHRTRLFILGLVISAAGALIYSFSYDFGSALLSRLLHDSGDAILGVSIMMAVSALASKGRAGGVVGAMAIVYVIANFVGAVASGYINQYFGYAPAIQVAALLTFASAIVLALAVKGGISRSPFAAKPSHPPASLQAFLP